jgi:hypothetical protein
MAQRSEERRSFKCLVCAARVGQLVPFCEWCGAKHAFAGGALVLTGAICQECGFQAPMPFSCCPDCRAQRRILCPACATALAVRQTCGHCGLHFLFFDKVRREHSRTHRPPPAGRVSIAARKLMFIVLVIVVGMPLSMGHNARWFGLGLIISLLAVLALRSAAVRSPAMRRTRAASRDPVTVMETYDLAEAMAARAWLRLSGIDAQTTCAPGRGTSGSPPGGLRRIVVARVNVARAAGCLADHGFDLTTGVRPQAPAAPRWNLRLVHSASTRGADRGHKRNHD